MLCGDHALPPPLEFCCLLLIVPPCLGRAAGKARLLGWEAEHVPVGDAVRRQIPVRYPITAGADDAIEGTAGDGQFGPSFGLKDFSNERTHDRVGDAREIE